MKKIIAFVSLFSRDFNITSEPKKYYYGSDNVSFVTGRQTNEAPIKYLLSKYNDIDQIICIVSKGTTEPVKEDQKKVVGELPPYDYLKNEILSYTYPNGHSPVNINKKEFFYQIEYNEKEKSYFGTTILPRLLDLITPDDSVFLETTGGLRDNVTQMMLLTKILTFQGTNLEAAVYSNNYSETIFDVTDSYREFDLMNALTEFKNHGATNLLELYFTNDEKTNESINNLVQSMTELTTAVTLCRTNQLDVNDDGNKITKVEKALKEVQDILVQPQNSNIQILKILLPIFKRKFEQLRTTPEQIIWCAKNNLIQQALTLYTDRLQRYIIKTSRLILIKNADDRTRINDLRNSDYVRNKNKDDYALIFDDCLSESYRQKNDSTVYSVYEEINDTHSTTIECISVLRKKSDRYALLDSVSDDEYKSVLRNFCYAQVLRNQLNHAEGSLGKQESKSNYLKTLGYKVEIDSLSINDIVKFLDDSMTNLQTVIKKAHKED